MAVIQIDLVGDEKEIEVKKASGCDCKSACPVCKCGGRKAHASRQLRYEEELGLQLVLYYDAR